MEKARPTSALRTVTTNAAGNASFNTTFSGVSVPAGAAISATATDSSRNTSEFAQDALAVNQPPTVVTAASATPNPVTGASTTLSVLGGDLGGESNLTYTWSTTGSPPAPVVFSANGTNAAKNVTATFAAAGSYDFQVTIADPGGLSTTSSVSVTVNQTLSSIVIGASGTPGPGPAAMADNTTYPFSATGLDQFGNPLSSQPAFTWSVDGGGTGGTINAAGVYSTPASGMGTDTILRHKRLDQRHDLGRGHGRWDLQQRRQRGTDRSAGLLFVQRRHVYADGRL